MRPSATIKLIPRARALGYLENIPLDLLGQILHATTLLNAREEARLFPRRKTMYADVVDRDSQGIRRRRRYEGRVGIEMRLKNRKTGSAPCMGPDIR